MKILLVAPQPFYEERGTPIAVDLLARALQNRGDDVTVLTTHLGSDRPGLRITRVRPWFAPKALPPGLSLGKLYTDLFIWARLLRVAKRRDFDVVHAVEEASFMAWSNNLLRRVPFIVDVDSSMATQLIDKSSFLSRFSGLLRWFESLPLKRAAGAAVVCEALAGPARQYCKGVTVLLPDVSLRKAGADNADDLRAAVGNELPIALYVGNLESYQGIDFLLRSFAELCGDDKRANLVIIGGSPDHIEKYRKLAADLEIDANVFLLGPRPLADLDGYLRQADFLVSPRTQGVNTPMKIYSYLDSGTPLVATGLPTHTQVMTSSEAALAPPETAAYASAMRDVIEKPDYAAQLATNARELIARKHSSEAFQRQVNEFYGQIEQRLTDTQ